MSDITTGGVLLVFNTKTNALAHATPVWSDHCSMPGYTDSVVKGYEGSPYYAVFVSTESIASECLT